MTPRGVVGAIAVVTSLRAGSVSAAGSPDVQAYLRSPAGKRPDPQLVERRDTHVIASGMVGGLGLASVIAGAALTGHASSPWEATKRACPQLAKCRDGGAAALSREALVAADAATGTGVVGGVALATALVVSLTAPDAAAAAAAPDVGVELSPGAAGFKVQLRGRW